MGARLDETPDTLTIYHSKLNAANIDGRHDHRIVMATAVAGMIAEGETVIEGAEWVGVSFPNFYEMCQSLGAEIQRLKGV
jgi:3-phosphoshikimate 1-carboxyvinyltransferase